MKRLALILVGMTACTPPPPRKVDSSPPFALINHDGMPSAVAVTAHVTTPMCRYCIYPEPNLTPGFGWQCMVGWWGYPLHPYGPRFRKHDDAQALCKTWQPETEERYNGPTIGG